MINTEDRGLLLTVSQEFLMVYVVEGGNMPALQHSSPPRARKALLVQHQLVGAKNWKRVTGWQIITPIRYIIEQKACMNNIIHAEMVLNPQINVEFNISTCLSSFLLDTCFLPCISWVVHIKKQYFEKEILRGRSHSIKAPRFT